MVLGSDKIFELIETKNLIENLPEDGFNIEGCTVDFRFGALFRHYGNALLKEDSRNTGDVIEEDHLENNMYMLLPKTTYLISTVEKVNIPNFLVMHIDTRTTMFRSGIQLTATYTNPGYSGQLTFMAYNFTDSIVYIQKGFRIAQACFHQIYGNVDPYIGQWQNGKVHTNNKEVGPR